MRAFHLILFICAGVFAGLTAYADPAVQRRAATSSDVPVAGDGYAVNAFARGVGAARALAVHAPSGDVLVLDGARGRVLRLKDRNRDGISEMKSTYLSGFDRPSGMTLSETHIYISDAAGVWRAPLSAGLTARTPATLLADLSKVDTAVTPRPLALIEEGKALLIGLGAKSAREQEPAPAASLVRIDIATGRAALYAGGLRRVMALRAAPEGKVAALISESAPAPDYFTLIDKGGFYGWPYAYGEQVPIAGQARKAPYKIAGMRAPLLSFDGKTVGADMLMPWETRAAGAAAGLAGKSILIIGEGRPNLRGPNVIAMDLAGGILGGEGAAGAPILSGFAPPRGSIWGQPSALAISPTGALLVADRWSETIWRVTTAPIITEPEIEKEAEPEPKVEPEKADDAPVKFRSQTGRTRPLGEDR